METALFLSSIAGLRQSGEYSDLKIMAADEIYNVHKNLVLPRSIVLRKCWQYGKAGVTDTLDLSEDDPDLIYYLIDYLYLLDYSEREREVKITVEKHAGHPVELEDAQVAEGTNSEISAKGRSIRDDLESDYGEEAHNEAHVNQKKTQKESITDEKVEQEPKPALANEDIEMNLWLSSLPQPVKVESKSAFAIHAGMYVLADRLQIDGLKIMACSKFKRQAECDWSTPEFLVAVRVAYTSTPEADRGLREAVIATISNHHELVDDLKVRRLATEPDMAGFAYDLFQYVYQKQRNRSQGVGSQGMCQKCRQWKY